MENTARKIELIKRLRSELNLTEDLATDREILKATKGTYLRARIELIMAWQKIIKNCPKN